MCGVHKKWWIQITDAQSHFSINKDSAIATFVKFIKKIHVTIDLWKLRKKCLNGLGSNLRLMYGMSAQSQLNAGFMWPALLTVIPLWHTGTVLRLPHLPCWIILELVYAQSGTFYS